MPQEVKLWRVHSGDKLEPYTSTVLDLEERLERWIEADISVLSSDLLVIGRQVETRFGGYIDLLCLDSQGNTVIVELKRDKTPRDVVAQVLDYASWARELSNTDLTSIASQYFGQRGSLDEMFAAKFGFDLPDVVNEDHRMIVVGSRIDSSTERIIEYLSDEHGVGINAASFQFLADPAGGRTLARVFLIEPDRVDQQARSHGSSKRRPSLTPEELSSIAESAGVGEIYLALAERLRGVFGFVDTTRSSLRFGGEIDGRRRAIFSLLPGESSAERGLHFQVYWKRLCDFFDLRDCTPDALLPKAREDWAYSGTSAPDANWTGYSGYFSSEAEVSRFVGELAKPRKG